MVTLGIKFALFYALWQHFKSRAKKFFFHFCHEIVFLYIVLSGLEPTPIPTGSLTILKPSDQGIGDFYVVQVGRATDFEAPKFERFGRDNSFAKYLPHRLWPPSMGLSEGIDCPTNPFTLSELQDQQIGKFGVVQERRGSGFKTPKL